MLPRSGTMDTMPVGNLFVGKPVSNKGKDHVKNMENISNMQGTRYCTSWILLQACMTHGI